MELLKTDDNGISRYSYYSVTQKEFDRLKSHASLRLDPYPFDDGPTYRYNASDRYVRGRASLWNNNANGYEIYVLNGILY